MNGTEFARIGGSYNTAYICTYQVIEQNVNGNYTVFRLYGYFYYGGGTQVSSATSGGNLLADRLPHRKAENPAAGANLSGHAAPRCDRCRRSGSGDTQ